MSSTFQAGRRLGVIADIRTRESGFIFIRDEQDEEYFTHCSAFEARREFDEVEQGDPVSFRIAETPKGKRAFSVKPASVTERVEIMEWEETRGNK